jgi:hypothetical protein
MSNEINLRTIFKRAAELADSLKQTDGQTVYDITDSAERLKRSLGCPPPLDRPLLPDQDPPLWRNFHNNFSDLDCNMATRNGLVRLAFAAIRLSSLPKFDDLKASEIDRGSRTLGEGLRQVFPALTDLERKNLRDEIRTLKAVFGWTTKGNSLPLWKGDGRISSDDMFVTIDVNSGYHPTDFAYVEKKANEMARGADDARSRRPVDVEPTPADDPYKALREFASENLIGKERDVIEILCENKGQMRLADLGLKRGLDWVSETGFKDARRRLNPKLKPMGWKLERRKGSAHLVKIGVKPGR